MKRYHYHLHFTDEEAETETVVKWPLVYGVGKFELSNEGPVCTLNILPLLPLFSSLEILAFTSSAPQTDSSAVITF